MGVPIGWRSRVGRRLARRFAARVGPGRITSASARHASDEKSDGAIATTRWARRRRRRGMLHCHPASPRVGRDAPRLGSTLVNPAELAAALLDVVTATAAATRAGFGRASPPRTSLSSAPATATTATGHRTSPSSSASASASTRAAFAVELVRGARRRSTGIASAEVAGPGLPQHPARCSGGRRARPTHRRAGRRPTVAAPCTTASRSTSSSSRRTRPARCTSAARAGPLSATASRACSRRRAAIVTREYYFNDHGIQIDRFARSLLAAHLGEPAPDDGYGGALHPRDRGPRRGRLPRRCGGAARPAARRGAGGVPRARREADVRRDQGEPARLRRRLRRLHAREHAARIRRGRARHRPAAGARSHLRGGRRDLAAHHRVRRRQRPRDHQEGRRGAPTSPATSPTTSTSASADSSATSSCSAPTTTATSSA